MCLDESIHTVKAGQEAIELRRVPDHQHQARKGRGHAESIRLHDRCGGPRRPGVARRHARERHRPRPQHSSVDTAELFTARRRGGQPPVLRSGFDRARDRRQARRHDRGAGGSRHRRARRRLVSTRRRTNDGVARVTTERSYGEGGTRAASRRPLPCRSFWHGRACRRRRRGCPRPRASQAAEDGVDPPARGPAAAAHLCRRLLPSRRRSRERNSRGAASAAVVFAGLDGAREDTDARVRRRAALAIGRVRSRMEWRC